MRDEIEIQNELRGRIMSALLARGIRRQDFSSEEFYEPFKTDIADFRSFDGLFTDMLVWLRHEGFVRYSGFCSGSNGEMCVTHLQVTARGMAILDLPLPQEPHTTGKDLVRAAGSEDGDVASKVKLGAFIGAVLGGFTSAISS